MNTTARTVLVSAGAVAVLGLAGTATATAADLTTADHHQAVATVAQADAASPNNQLQTGPGAVPATYTNTPQQVNQSTAVGVGVGTTGVILLGFLVWYAAKHHQQKWSWLIVSFALGVSLSTSVLGNLSTSLVNSGVSAVSNVAGSIGSSGH